ncbi:hypothetical protein RB195_014475 [Necator americanus]|uniref:FAD-binding PCMH-type domain-containing protein n=1 Tax=Necator americanus TaxID=51031 RepID=A0ABR1E093_NECAM
MSFPSNYTRSASDMSTIARSTSRIRVFQMWMGFVLRRQSSTLQSSFYQFEAILGKESVSVKESIRTQFSRDEGHLLPRLPAVVLSPKSVEEVSAVVRVCSEQSIPIVAYGTGTGLEGGSVSLKDGVCLSTIAIEGGICELNEADFDASVRPSVTRKQLNVHIRNTGLFFPVVKQNIVPCQKSSKRRAVEAALDPRKEKDTSDR